MIEFVEFIEERKSKKVTKLVDDSATLDRICTLRDIADELDKIKSVELVIKSEVEILKEKHKDKLSQCLLEQKSEMEKFVFKQKAEVFSLTSRHREENIKLEKNIADNKAQRSKMERKMQAHIPSVMTSASPDVPECPVCMEEMMPPMKIFNCRNGHLICSDCRPNVTKCTICRAKYVGRAIAVEQMLRQMFNCQ